MQFLIISIKVQQYHWKDVADSDMKWKGVSKIKKMGVP